ncbi:MAG: hypothetical protein PHY80_05605 [Rickettsiales bacterium]|nr:hypothetical protein [Rickettsiales bacterium]
MIKTLNLKTDMIKADIQTRLNLIMNYRANAILDKAIIAERKPNILTEAEYNEIDRSIKGNEEIRQYNKYHKTFNLLWEYLKYIDYLILDYKYKECQLNMFLVMFMDYRNLEDIINDFILIMGAFDYNQISKTDCSQYLKFSSI